MTRASRIICALLYAAACHSMFALGVGLMIFHLFFGLQLGLGRVPEPWGWAANLALLAQFPLLHSVLLTGSGRRILERLGPDNRLVTTTYALVASIQLAILFTLWTPSGMILWRAEGQLFWLMCAAYAAAWGYLGLAILQGGLQLQSGMLGWLAMLRGRQPVYPDMQTRGLYRVSRQPIYLGFALTLWTMPTYTPDQLCLAVLWTLYCFFAPLHKERRFTRIHGSRFAAYQAEVPYWFPLPRKRQSKD